MIDGTAFQTDVPTLQLLPQVLNALIPLLLRRLSQNIILLTSEWKRVRVLVWAAAMFFASQNQISPFV